MGLRNRPDVRDFAIVGTATLLLSLFFFAARASEPIRPISRLASNVILPQRQVIDMERRGKVELRAVRAEVRIEGQAARTTLEVDLFNPTSRRLEAEVMLPVPEGAAVGGFAFQGGGTEPSAVLLPKGEARRIYDQIVAQVRDPALLEFVGYNLIRSSVFPVEPKGEQRIRLTYEHILPADGPRREYVLPRSESLDYTVPWRIDVTLRSPQPVSAIYSPTHAIETEQDKPTEAAIQLARRAEKEPGAFHLTWLVPASDRPTASLMAYPDPSVGGGYFLFLAGVPPRSREGRDDMQREVTFVFDRSGSMKGEKMTQVRKAASAVLDDLKDGEYFNIIAYNEQVDRFADAPVAKSPATLAAARRYLESIQPRGGTNIHDAVLEALRQPPSPGALPVALFLTDGLPTIGSRSERKIRALAEKHNPHKRRVFTFGVGVDVNTPLLDKIALETRATSSFVLPGQQVDREVDRLFRRLRGPVLTEPSLKAIASVGASRREMLNRVRECQPTELRDVFEGDTVLVYGQYVGEAPISFELSGGHPDRRERFRFDFDLSGATTRNSFVPRLWASRKIAALIDAVREMGASDDPLAPPADVMNDPRFKELTEEIVRLSTEFGILTEYTAFLAREGMDLAATSDAPRVLREAEQNLNRRAIQMRFGAGSVAQSLNAKADRSREVLNKRNAYINDEFEQQDAQSVRQIGDRTYYKRGNRWVDSRLLTKGKAEAAAAPARTVNRYEDKDFVDGLVEENRQATLSLPGEVVMERDGEAVLVE